MEQTTNLATLLAELSDRDGFYDTAISGLHLSKFSTTDAPRTSVDRAVLCVVAQGAKRILVNDEWHWYDPSTYFLLSLDLPLIGQIATATPEMPCLCLSLDLDLAEISALILQAGLQAPSDAFPHQRFVHPLDTSLLDALIRLVCLLKHPEQIPILAPLLRREILYKLLLSERSGLLHRMTAENSQVGRIVAGIAWLRKNATRTIRVDELARELHMSPSLLYASFKAATNMSPVQFQKQLRLQEARRILLSEATDAVTAGQRVGYESPSQFSREYRRLFGLPPLQDIERLRTMSGNSHAPMRQPEEQAELVT